MDIATSDGLSRQGPADALCKRLREGALDTVVLCLPDLQGRLVGKRLTAEHFSHDPYGAHGACDYLFAYDLDLTPLDGFANASWSLGYGDMEMVLDFATWRVIPWEEKTALVLCDAHTSDGLPVPVSPRFILQRQLQALEEHGLFAEMASELEFYAFPISYRDAHKQRYDDLATETWFPDDYQLSSGGRDPAFLKAVRTGMEGAGIPVESSKGEWGPGQIEVNLRHADALTMADNHCIFKTGVKDIAAQHGRSVSFMAKWNAKEAGSSCHIHLSLWKDAERLSPAFCSDDGQMSGVMRKFLAGQLSLCREMTLLLAPYVNSYKRFRSGSFAPTRIGWACDNRTTSFRVVGRDRSLRIECRVAGADANPYLAYAALLAAGRYGIDHNLELPSAISGNGYHATHLPIIPASLEEAIAALDESSVMKDLLGADVVAHYVHLARWEASRFSEAVTDWERCRYFERV